MQNAGRNDVSEPLCCTANQKGKWEICHWRRQVAMGSRWKIKTSKQRHGDVFFESNLHKQQENLHKQFLNLHFEIVPGNLGRGADGQREARQDTRQET